MKILHISTSDNAGAGLCCLRIHTSMLKAGVDSKMVVLVKSRKDVPAVYQYGSLIDTLYRYVSKAFRILGLTITERNKIIRLAQVHETTYTSPISYVDLTKCDLIEWADVIHLHWVNNYLDYPSFFKKIKKPIVWTLHDENLFYGIAHHHKSILPDNKFEKKYRSIKRNAIRSAQNLSVVFLSDMMLSNFGKEEIISGRPKTVINNSVDGKIFKSFDRKQMRRKYGMSEEKIFFFFMANDIADPNKGLDVLVKALLELNNDNLKIIAVGSNPQKKSWPLVLPYGRIDNPNILCELISMANYFAMPSYQEAFPQSPLEAMACGLPVVTFPVSGTKEMIRDSNGVICNDFSVKSLLRGIEILLKTDYDGDKIREDVLVRFSPKKICTQYIDLYKNILNYQ